MCKICSVVRCFDHECLRRVENYLYITSTLFVCLLFVCSIYKSESLSESAHNTPCQPWEGREMLWDGLAQLSSHQQKIIVDQLFTQPQADVPFFFILVTFQSHPIEHYTLAVSGYLAVITLQPAHVTLFTLLPHLRHFFLPPKAGTISLSANPLAVIVRVICCCMHQCALGLQALNLQVDTAPVYKCRCIMGQRSMRWCTYNHLVSVPLPPTYILSEVILSISQSRMLSNAKKITLHEFSHKHSWKLA